MKNLKKFLPVGICVFLLYLCIRYWDPLITVALRCLSAGGPLVVGCALAYVVNILMDFYERHYFPRSVKKGVLKSRRPICLTAAFLTLLAIIAVIIGLIIPQLIECVILLAEKIPPAITQAIGWMDERDLLTDQILTQLKEIDWAAILNSVSGWLTSGLGSMIDIVVTTVSTLVSVIVTIFVAVVFSIYLLSSKEKLAKQSNRLMKRYLRPRLIDKIKYVLDILNTCFRRYIVGQCTEAVILGLLCLTGMLILQLPYATMISAFVAFTALIPFAGAYIGAAVGAFMILTVSPIKALIFLIFLVILQQLEGNLIYPRVVGSSLELPPLWVLAAITIGGGMFGIIGMLLGVPITAAIYRIVRADLRKGEKKAGEDGKDPMPGAPSPEGADGED